jgi:hypothetical protein
VGAKLHLQQELVARAFHGLKQQLLKQRALGAWLRHGRQRRKLAWAEAHWRRRALVSAFFEWQFAAAKQRWVGGAPWGALQRWGPQRRARGTAPTSSAPPRVPVAWPRPAQAASVPGRCCTPPSSPAGPPAC